MPLDLAQSKQMVWEVIKSYHDASDKGDLDIIGYTGKLDAQRQVKVYRNDLPAQNWIHIRPVGAPGNRGAAQQRSATTDVRSVGRPRLPDV